MKLEVYKVESKESSEIVFTGAWEEAKVCWENQLDLLRRGQFPHKNLQSHFNKFGESDLIMSIVKKVDDYTEVGGVINRLLEPKEKPKPPVFPSPRIETHGDPGPITTIPPKPEVKKRIRRKKK